MNILQCMGNLPYQSCHTRALIRSRFTPTIKKCASVYSFTYFWLAVNVHSSDRECNICETKYKLWKNIRIQICFTLTGHASALPGFAVLHAFKICPSIPSAFGQLNTSGKHSINVFASRAADFNEFILDCTMLMSFDFITQTPTRRLVPGTAFACPDLPALRVFSSVSSFC